VARDPRNGERIFPYLGGAEVNTSPTQDFDRYVISFGQMELEEAERWPDLLEIVREKVKPERDELRSSADGGRRKQCWWQFDRSRPALYAALEGKQRCLVTARTSKHTVFSLQPTGRIYSENLVIFALDSFAAFAVLQSQLHGVWVGFTSSTLETRQGYRPSDCFETFPFPPEQALGPDGLVEKIGNMLYQARAKLMIEREQGLTTTYNQLKDPEVHDLAIEPLRELHIAMDAAVLAAYGWADLTPPPFTDPVTGEERRTREAFEDEIIDRLFALNAQRAEQEKILGLTSAKSKKQQSRKKQTRKKATQATQATMSAQLSLTGEPEP
jgi:hypothetical protein